MKIKNKIILIFTAFLFVVLGIVGLVHHQVISHFEKLNSDNMEVLYETIRSKIKNANLELQNELDAKKHLYTQLHRTVEAYVKQHGKNADLAPLREELMKAHPALNIDLFVINDDLVITNTTFTPDLHLDFKSPHFEDSRKALEDKRRETPEEIFVSYPFLELVTKKFKSYSYTYLPEMNIFIEVGFTDREINEFIKRNFTPVFPEHKNVTIHNYYEKNDCVTDISQLKIYHPELGSKEKQEAMVLERVFWRDMNRKFQKVDQEGSFYKEEVVEGESVYYDYYTQLLSIKLTGEHRLRFLSNIRIDVSEFILMQKKLQQLFYSVVAFAVLLFVVLFFIVKQSLLKPIQVLSRAMHSKSLVKNKKIQTKGDELSLLITQYNSMLEDLNSLHRNLAGRVEEEVKQNLQQKKMLELQSRQAQMGELLSMIAHQWKQPLSIISGLTQNIGDAKQFGELDDALLESSNEKILSQVEYMSQTIDDFKNFFKREKNKKNFRLKHTVQEALELVGNVYEKAEINIVINGDESLQSHGHPNEYKQVLINILNNARDAFIERGITARKVEILIYKEGDMAVVTIEDNAGGIPEAIIGKIFDSYVSTKGEEKGTGIGLYMSKIIIEENMGGVLSVENTTAGARFKIATSLNNSN